MADHTELLAEVAARLGVTASPVLIPSDEADVFRVGPFVVKVERFEGLVAREAVALPALRARGFAELPEILLTHADFGVETPVTVMRAAPSRPLETLSPAQRVDVAVRVGVFLGRLSVLDWRTVPGAISPSEKRSSTRDWMARWLEPLAESRPEDVTDALACVDRDPDGFGGWQFAQLLTDGESLTLIDWGSIGAHWPVSDVVTTVATFDDVDRAMSAAFLDAYGPVDADELARWWRHWLVFDAAATARLPP